MKTRWKGLNNFLKEDPSLTEKKTYSQHIDSTDNLDSNDCTVQEALDSYNKLKSKDK